MHPGTELLLDQYIVGSDGRIGPWEMLLVIPPLAVALEVASA